MGKWAKIGAEKLVFSVGFILEKWLKYGKSVDFVENPVGFQVPFSASYEILGSAENTVFSRIFYY